MRFPFSRYRTLDRNVKFMILGEAVVQILNGAFFLIANLYLAKEGFSDQEISDYTYYRYLGVMFLAMPFGMLIKTKKLMPFFYVSPIAMCLCSVLIIYGIDTNNLLLSKICLCLWGIFFMLIEVVKLPFVMRYCPKEQHSMAIALTFSTWSLGAIIAGVISFLLHAISPSFFQERNVMYSICALALFSIFFFSRVKLNERIPKETQSGFNLRDYDWWLVAKAVFPTLVIAIGAGLTVPFINLFFHQVHGLEFEEFSSIGSVAYAMVFLTVLFAPGVKDKWGYKIAIPSTQTLAVLALVGLALTEFFPGSAVGVTVAVFFFIIRQPLMNLAQPLSSQLVLNYVGKRNEEIIGAFQSTIWNGSFVFSALIFGKLRALNISYIYIFLMTAALYLLAILMYVLLIRDYEKRVKLVD